ncbi:MAG: MFS transporter [Hyphomicrobium sp.]
MADDTNGTQTREDATRAGDDPYLGVRVSLFFGALFFVYGMFVPYLPVWLDFSGLTATEISTVIAAPFFIRIIATPCVTLLADRIANYRLVVIVLAWTAFVAALLLSQMSGYAAILVAAVAFLLATSSMMPLTETIAIGSVRTAGLDYGRMRLWGSITFIVANLAGGLLIDKFGGGVGVWLLVGAAAIAVIFAHQLPGSPPTVAAQSSSWASWRTSLPMRLIRSRYFVFFLIAIGCLHGAHATFYTFGAVEWEAQGLSGAWIGALWAIGVIAEVILFAYSGSLGQRLGAVGLILAGAVAGVLRWTAMAFDPPLEVLIPLQAFHALTFGAAHVGAMLFIARAVPHKGTGSAQALYAIVAAGLGVGAVGLASGPLYAAYGGRMYFLPAALALIGFAAGFALLKGWQGGALWPEEALSPKDRE